MSTPLPSNLRAEESVLGAMLLSPLALVEALAIVNADDFYHPSHKLICAAISDLADKGQAVDAVTVATELGDEKLERIGGSVTLLDLQAKTPAISNAEQYANLVADASLLRAADAAARETISAIAEGGDAAQLLGDAESRILSVRGNRLVQSGTEAKDLAGLVLDNLEMLYERGDAITGGHTGYLDIDEILGGLQDEALYVVGARPAMGKTAWSLGAAASLARSAPVLFFSLEMGEVELGKRVIGSMAKVDSERLRNGRLDEPQWKRVAEATGRFAELELVFYDNPSVTIQDIRAKAIRAKQKYGFLGGVFVDYIQLMTGRANAGSRQIEVSEISRGLKILARELKCPVVALAQLNRQLEQRYDKRPQLSDLRESGSLEQDADVVLFLYRDEVYDRESPDRGVAEVIVAKHRNGPTGFARLAFLDRYATFENMARMG